MAPVGTSEAIVRKVSEDLRKVVVDPELDKKLATLGSYTHPMSPTKPPRSSTSSNRCGSRCWTTLPERSDDSGIMCRGDRGDHSGTKRYPVPRRSTLP